MEEGYVKKGSVVSDKSTISTIDVRPCASCGAIVLEAIRLSSFVECADEGGVRGRFDVAALRKGGDDCPH